MQKHSDFKPLKAKDIMSPDPRTIHPSTSAYEALQIMKANSITQLLITQENDYLGIIHIHDILREGII